MRNNSSLREHFAERFRSTDAGRLFPWMIRGNHCRCSIGRKSLIALVALVIAITHDVKSISGDRIGVNEV
jgi:hypothetical protein